MATAVSPRLLNEIVIKIAKLCVALYDIEIVPCDQQPSQDHSGVKAFDSFEQKLYAFNGLPCLTNVKLASRLFQAAIKEATLQKFSGVLLDTSNSRGILELLSQQVPKMCKATLIYAVSIVQQMDYPKYRLDVLANLKVMRIDIHLSHHYSVGEIESDAKKCAAVIKRAWLCRSHTDFLQNGGKIRCQFESNIKHRKNRAGDLEQGPSVFLCAVDLIGDQQIFLVESESVEEAKIRAGDRRMLG